jgi:hypothetical protein
MIQQRAALLNASLAHFSKQDPRAKQAAPAALRAAETPEDKKKIFGGPMFSGQAWLAEQEDLVMRILSVQTHNAFKKDERGMYINPWDAMPKPSR